MWRFRLVERSSRQRSKKVLRMHSLQSLLYGGFVVRQLRGPEVGFSMQSEGSLASKLRMIGLKPAGGHPLPLSRASSSRRIAISRSKFSKRPNMYRKQPIARDRIRFIQFFPENCPDCGPGAAMNSAYPHRHLAPNQTTPT